MPKVFSKRLFNERGITLIELIAVILILGIIAAVGIPVIFNQISGAEDAADAANMAIVNDAVERYAIMNGGYIPDDATDIVTTGTNEVQVNSLIDYLKAPPATTKGGPFLSDAVDIQFNADPWPALVIVDNKITGIK